ncbi:MAG TPA: carbohydrate ABC transporter permease [Ktedonobacterales bacterium]|nr:carbohydrate ABC transporter permease [Ktedonobacterales bacterium]
MAETTLARPAAESISRTRKNIVPRRVKTTLLYVILTIIAVVWLIPILSALYTALRTFADGTANGPWSFPPHSLTLENFTSAWTDGGFSHYFLNTFLVVIPAVILMLLLSSMSAYVLARHRFRGSRAIFMIFVAGLLLPFQILLIPVYRLSNFLNIYDNLWALIAIHVAFELGFCTFVLHNFMRTIPKDLTDAAAVDGASVFWIWWRVILPLCRPALAALATLEFTWKWNDYLWVITLIQSDANATVTLGLSGLRGEFVTNWNLISAASLLAALPTLIIYAVLQRQFLGGLFAGSFK